MTPQESRIVKALGVCCLLTAILFWKPLTAVLSESPSAAQTLLDFHADRPAPPVVKGDVSRTPDGVLHAPEGSAAGMGFVFDIMEPGRVTVALAARSSRGGALEVLVEDKSGRFRRVARTHGLRDRAFDLTPFVTPDRDWAIWIRSPGGEGITVREVFLRQSPSERFPRVHWALFAAVPVLVIISLLRRRFGPRTGAVAIGLLAFASRWQELAGWVAQPLRGDAVSYHQIAEGMSWGRPFVTGMREPLQVWIQGAFMDAGWGLMATRLFSVAASSVTAALVAVLAWRLFGRFAGVAAGLLFALGDFHIWNALRGERSETYLVVLLAFLLVLVTRRDDRRLRVDLALGGLAGVAALTWLIAAPATCLAFLARLKEQGQRVRRSALFLAPLALMLLPHFVSQMRIHGDPFHALNAHTAYYRSAEITGTPSYNVAHGGAMAAFLVEKPLRRLGDLLNGYARIFIDPRSAFNRIFLGFHYDDGRVLLLFPVLILGLIEALRRRRWLFFWLAFSVINVAPALLAEVRDPRLFLFAAPFVAMLFGAGVGVLAEIAGQWLHRGRVRLLS